MSSNPGVELSSQIPLDLAEKGWKLFVRDSTSPFNAVNEQLDIETGGYPDVEGAIGKARELAVEEEERQAIASDGSLLEEPTVKIEPGRQQLPVNSIRIDGGTQPRSALDMLVVADYKDAMLRGAEFPPVDVFFDGKDLWLADGFHRLQARKEAGVESDATVTFGVIEAEVAFGTKRDALLYALGANATHGLPRSREDKRRAVTMMLEDPEWTAFSDSAIAMKCNVSQPFVSKLRRELTSQNVLSEQPSRVGTDGVVRDVSNIGKAAEDDDRQASFARLADNADEDSPYEVLFNGKVEWEPVDEDDLRRSLGNSFDDVDAVVQELGKDRTVVRTAYARYRRRGSTGEPFRVITPDEEKVEAVRPTAPSAEAKDHEWRKVSLVTERGGYDKYRCERCGATGKRWGVSWPPVVDAKQPVECTVKVETARNERATEDVKATEDEERNTAWTSEGIVELLSRHGGVLMRMQLEEMGVSYAGIHNALAEGAIIQPETGKFTLPDHKPQPQAGPDTAATATRSSEPQLPKTSIEDLLKGRKLSLSFVWIPGLKGKVSVTVNAGDKPENAERQLVDSDRVRGFHADVQKMIVNQLDGVKPAKSSTPKVVKKATPSKSKKAAPRTTKKPAPKKKAATKKKAAKGRKR